MPLETATYISTLDPANPLGSDPIATADDHLRLIKKVLKDTFPNMSAAFNETQATIDTLRSNLNAWRVPAGFIGMWSGAVTAIPTGWFLCDGLNGTPDLRDRFVVGAGSSYAVGATGGAITATTSSDGAHTHTTQSAGAHTHSGATGGHALTVDQIPSHTHAIISRDGSEAGTYPKSIFAGTTTRAQTAHTTYTEATGGGQAHSHSISSDGSHVHTVDSSGAHTHTVDTRSPYYALAYIMKS